MSVTSRRVFRSIGVAMLSIVMLELPATADDLLLTRLDQYLEALRQQAGIKGLAAAIVQNGAVAWERAYGLADVENVVATWTDTPFPIGGLTQVLSASLVLRCSEAGDIGLDDRMDSLTTPAAEPNATVRQVLSHTSSGQPGSGFAFDIGRYAALTPVVERCARDGFRQALYRDLFSRLGMSDSVPGRDLRDLALADGSDDRSVDRISRETVAAWDAVLARLAKPYKVDKNGKAAPGVTLSGPALGANASTGAVSTVRDLAKFDTALDDGLLLRAETLTASWTNQPLNDGRFSPMGLGWFSQVYNGERVVWQYSLLPEGYSSLYLRLPARRVSVILLANTDGLAADIPLSEGDVRVSPFARLFLQLFL